MFPVKEGPVEAQLEDSVSSGEIDGTHFLDNVHPLAPVGDQVGHGGHLQAVRKREFQQLAQPRHFAVLSKDLANHPGRAQLREPRKIHRRLGVSGTHQDSPLRGLEGKRVARAHDVRAGTVIVHQDRNRACPVSGADSRGNAAGRIDGFHERGPEAVAVSPRGHAGKTEAVKALPCHGHADQPPSVSGHEVDGGVVHLLCSHHEVPLVLAVLVVGYDNDLPPANGRNHIVYRIKHPCSFLPCGSSQPRPPCPIGQLRPLEGETSASHPLPTQQKSARERFPGATRTRSSTGLLPSRLYCRSRNCAVSVPPVRQELRTLTAGWDFPARKRNHPVSKTYRIQLSLLTVAAPR